MSSGHPMAIAADASIANRGLHDVRVSRRPTSGCRYAHARSAERLHLVVVILDQQYPVAFVQREAGPVGEARVLGLGGRAVRHAERPAALGRSSNTASSKCPYEATSPRIWRSSDIFTKECVYCRDKPTQLDGRSSSVFRQR